MNFPNRDELLLRTVLALPENNRQSKSAQIRLQIFQSGYDNTVDAISSLSDEAVILTSLEGVVDIMLLNDEIESLIAFILNYGSLNI